MNTTSNGGGSVSFGQDFHGFAAMVGHGHDGSGALQQFRRDLLVHLVVFDQQDADSRGIMHSGVVFPSRERWSSSPATPNRSTRVS